MQDNERESDGEVLLCFHCGNRTYMDLLKSHKVVNYDVIDEENGFTIDTTKVWRMLCCKTCKNVTLRKIEWFSEFIDYRGKPIVETATVCPYMTIKNDNMPKGVSDAYESAINVRHIDGAICALSLRRTLERMCKDKGAAGRDLYTKLKQLSEMRVLPPIIDEMAHILKDLGNEAAHADEVDFDDQIVNSMIEFTGIILDYVYAIPEKINQVQTLLSKRVSDTERD